MSNKTQNNKIGLIWALLCTTSTIDSETNNVSITNIIEEISIPKEVLIVQRNSQALKESDPVIITGNFQLIALWQKLSGLSSFVAETKVQFIDPNGNLLSEIPVDLPFEKGKQRMRQRINISGISIVDKGIYTFNFLAREEDKKQFHEMGKLPLLVNII